MLSWHAHACMHVSVILRATFPTDDVWYTVVEIPVSCSLHLISPALRHQEKLTTYFKDGRKWCLVHGGCVCAMQRCDCNAECWCSKKRQLLFFRWSSIPSPIVRMDLEDFLDLITYTCPITGKQRCPVSAALQTTTDTKPKRLRVAWYPLASFSKSFPHSF